MKRRLLTQASVIAMVFAIAVVPVLAAQVFVEGFGDSALDTDGTAITTSNTSFTYVRTGSGGGSIESQNPSSLGGGVNNSNSMRLGGSSSTSLNGVGVTDDTFSPVMDVTTMNLKMKIESNVATNDAFYITMGDGSSFSSNTVFDTSHLMWGLRIHNGTVEYRTSGGSWNDVSTPATTLSDGTEYHLHIVANRSGSTIENYNVDEDIADGKMDLYIDDNLVANDIDITNNQNATAFRIYQINFICRPGSITGNRSVCFYYKI